MVQIPDRWITTLRRVAVIGAGSMGESIHSPAQKQAC